jgi:hypothetical protein
MADKAPKFARTPPSDPSDPSDLSDPSDPSDLSDPSDRPVCPVPGTCCDRRLPPNRSHPLPSGGQRREKRLHRLATGGYRQTVAIRCQAVDSGARNASTVWRQVATPKP